MQARIAILFLVLMLTALLAGPREDSGIAAIVKTADAPSYTGPDAVTDRHAVSTDELLPVCELLDEGFVKPTDMDWLLTRSAPLLSPDLVLGIREHAALLTRQSAPQQSSCDRFPDAARQQLCRAQHPAAFMARVFESLSMAIDGRRWVDTPYGRLDVERWQRAGSRDRPAKLMFSYCTEVLRSLDETGTPLQARVR